jgi:pyruvate/2-oxoglutarate/acetoin dehydrogenase E1 component
MYRQMLRSRVFEERMLPIYMTLRAGRDMTMVGLGRSVHDALAAAERLEHEDGLIKRLALPDVPIPFSRPLERFCLAWPDNIVSGVRAWLDNTPSTLATVAAVP